MDLMMVVVGRYYCRYLALLGTAACSTGVAAAATAATTSTTAASDAPSTAFATDGWLVGVAVARIARHLGCQIKKAKRSQNSEVSRF